MLIVKKFGGTSVGNKERIFNVAGRCAEEYRKGNDVVVVLSRNGKIHGRAYRHGGGYQRKTAQKRKWICFSLSGSRCRWR